MFFYEILLNFGLILIALIANFLSAFAGGGAGLLQLPALIFLGLPFASALATHKIASVALGIGASLRHSKEGLFDKKLAFLILAFGLPGVSLGANSILLIPDDLATRALGILNLFLGIYSSRRINFGTENKYLDLDNRRYLFGGLILFLIGFLNGSLTSGTGLFVTVWLVQWFGLTYTRAIAHTLVFVGLFWNGTGAFLLGINGEIKWEWLFPLISGSLLGGYLGAHFSLHKGERLIKLSFEALSFLMGISLILRSFV